MSLEEDALMLPVGVTCNEKEEVVTSSCRCHVPLGEVTRREDWIRPWHRVGGSASKGVFRAPSRSRVTAML